jgi:hypothetical protein
VLTDRLAGERDQLRASQQQRQGVTCLLHGRIQQVAGRGARRDPQLRIGAPSYLEFDP